jgi:hypothetical protein
MSDNPDQAHDYPRHVRVERFCGVEDYAGDMKHKFLL